ncbi:hypothetical protein MMC11_001025 [Xylographa trunciseda]|nr:hypothetical protein [Xylographa trunciseda]
MAPVSRRPDSKASPLASILAFASTLENTLSSSPRPVSLATDLYDNIDQLEERQLVAAGNFQDVDRYGTRLWNLSSRLKKDEATSIQLACLVRVFACLLLDCGHRSTAGGIANAVRVFKSALKTTKLCLDQRHIALAERIVEKAAHYEDVLKHFDKNESHEFGTLCNDLSNEYVMMRIALAWRQDRLDLAENWLAKLMSTSAKLDPMLSENLADLVFEIGKEQNNKAAYNTAVQWLERAHDVLRSWSLEDLSSDAGDLQTSILHTMARAFMKGPEQETRARAWNIAHDLDAGSSDKLAVLLLKLDILDTNAKIDAQDYCDLLLRIIRTIHVTESTFRTTLHYIHKLRPQSSTLAHVVLEKFLLERLPGTGKPEWMERLLVTMIWNLTTSTENEGHQNSLRQVLDLLPGHFPYSIGPSATHAAQTLIWKRIEACCDQGEYAEAISWSLLALHETFDSSGDLNIGKIQRKIIICTLATSDYATARTIFSRMSDTVQGAEETRYLMYKVGLRSGDSELALECLEAIYSGSDKDATMLYACVLEAQQTGQREQAISAMLHVLDRYNYGSPPGINLPALLRCTARLLIQEIESSTDRENPNIDAICKLFDGVMSEAAAQAKLQRRDANNRTFPLSELDWFSRNAYNMALRFCTAWNPPEVLRLVQACLKFIDLYPEDMDSSTLVDLALRRMFCDFLGASLLVMLARGEDAIEPQLQHYLDLRRHAKDFHIQFEAQIDSLQGGAKDDLHRKASTLLTFDFEAAVRLKAWDDVSQIVRDSHACGDSKLYSTIADIILASEAPTDTMITILQEIVNIAWRIGGIDTTKLSRWIRCLFQLALTSNLKTAELLLNQVMTLAEEGDMKGLLTTMFSFQEYPIEELEWLAATSFNRAVDFYCASQDDDCKRWAEMALGIANNARDGGQLHELLQTKYLGLKWED